MSLPIRISNSRVKISSRGVLASGRYRPGFPARNSLLPNHAKPRERAISAADAAVEDIDTDLIRRAGSPNVAEIPVAYLPARAEARSVDVWDDLWPESVKRAVIEAAPEVHRHKGTVYAVKTALAALGVSAEIREWWQQTPRGAPYTFTVRAIVQARLYDGPPLNPRTLKVIHASIVRAKPESRAFDLSITAGTSAPMGLAPVILPRFRVALGVAPVLPPGVSF